MRGSAAASGKVTMTGLGKYVQKEVGEWARDYQSEKQHGVFTHYLLEGIEVGL